ncbi:MAG: hypothetical protein M1833_002448 [Piccolia ochrophora]|nr:MAG: hypothetical protein M1833_002448 [Piccolia ochrophora]
MTAKGDCGESSLVPQTLIIPKDLSPSARIITLRHPRTSTLCRYLFCPDRGIHEFTTITAAKSSPRSLLFAASTPPKPSESPSPLTTGYVTANAALYIASRMDPLFLVLPALSPTKASSLYRSVSDHFDTLVESSPQMSFILDHQKTREMLEARLAAVCDVVHAGDEPMYRLSPVKLVQELMGKARRMVEHGLPAEIEDKFVRRALDLPVGCVGGGLDGPVDVSPEAEPAIHHEVTEEEPDLPDPPPLPSTESQTSSTSISTDASAISTPLTTPSPPPSAASSKHVELLRLQTALHFIFSQLPTALPSTLPLPDVFDPLTAHLAHLDSARKDYFAARSLTSSFTRKRALNDVEVAEERAEKKRKKDDEEKRKRAMLSSGVRQLRKVDVSGMKKMSDFFGAKPSTKKKA